jgi:Flp pilus assembly protein TadD
LAIPLSIVLITLVVFAPALWNDFVGWDDHMNLVKNPNYRGLGWTQLRWMVTTTLMGHWIPLTWVTFGLDYLLWGMNPFGYHLTNLLLHSANALVFYFVARRLLRHSMTGLPATTLRLGAGAAALFFALHPLRAESVAWVTERRDVLSGVFFLLTTLVYLKACEAEGARKLSLLAGSVGCYALALASKSIVMTLPLILILLDFYPLRRLGGRWREWTAPVARRIWAEKIPYLVLAIAGGGAALSAVAPGLTSLEESSLSDRVVLALHSLWFYVWKSLFPLGLSPLYELPARVSLLDPPFLLSAILVGIITAALFLLRRRWPAGLATWVAYGVILAPVSGLAHNGYQIVADRYSYFSCLGWALLVGGGVCALVRASASGALRPSLGRLGAGALAVSFVGLGALTWLQVQVWRDTQTLWLSALELNPDCAICHHNLGVHLDRQGRPVLAIEHLQRALALSPDSVMTYWRLGVAYLHAGRPAEAIPHFREVLRRSPLDGDIIRSHGSLGLALLYTGRPAEAIPHFREVLTRIPDDVDIHNHLGVALVQQGNLGEGIDHLRQAVRLDPGHAVAHTNLGFALTTHGNPTEAIAYFRRAIELTPENPEPRVGLARAYLALGKTGAAREEYEVVKRLSPRLASQLAPLLQR